MFASHSLILVNFGHLDNFRLDRFSECVPSLRQFFRARERAARILAAFKKFHHASEEYLMRACARTVVQKRFARALNTRVCTSFCGALHGDLFARANRALVAEGVSARERTCSHFPPDYIH